MCETWTTCVGASLSTLCVSHGGLVMRGLLAVLAPHYQRKYKHCSSTASAEYQRSAAKVPVQSQQGTSLVPVQQSEYSANPVPLPYR